MSSETKATEYQEQCMVNLFMEYGMTRREAAVMVVSLETSEAMNEMLDIKEAGDFKQPVSEIRPAVSHIWQRRQQKK